MAADLPRLRQADGARDRQGALPVSGSRRRVRRVAGRGGRWRRGGARRVRAAAGRHRSVRGQDRSGDPPSGPREEDQPHLSLGGRRQGRDRACAPNEPAANLAAHLVPALPSGAARAVRLRRPVRRDGPPAVLRDVAGAARLPHRARDRHRNPRGQDPRRLARPRRRIRQQGAGLSRIRLRYRRRAEAGTPGEMDREPHGEPDEHRLRSRLPHGRRDRRDRRRSDDGAARGDDGRSWRVRCGGGSDEVSGGHVRHRHRQLRRAGGARRSRCLFHQQGAGRHRVPLLVPRHRGELRDRARDGHPRRRAPHGSGGSAPQELRAEGSIPVSIAPRLHVRQRRLSEGARRRAREDRLQGTAEGADPEASSR